MADTEKSEQPQTNGLENGLDEDERSKLRPADIDADVKEMERRKRVEMIMSSKLFREELERIIELQMKDGNGPAGLLQQISDMMGIQSGKLHTTHMFRGSNCVTPINDIRGVESMGYEKGEKNLRCKLASVFRLMDLYGWSQGINNQITARLNQDEEHFLVNPHGMLFNEITASSLVKCDMQGNVVEPGTTNFNVHTQGFLLHSAIHASRPDVNCVIHIKTPSVLAVSSLKCGLLPLCQESLVIGEVSQHPFVCGIFEPEEREKIIRNLGPFNKVLLLYNHGAICCGATVEEAFYNVYNTVLACETQVKLMPIGIENLVLVNDETRKQVYDAAHKAPDAAALTDKKTKQFRVGELEFEALIRMLDNAGFRTGYIYRHPLVKGELPKPKNDVEVPPAVSSLGYLIEQEELYKQGNWKKYVDGRNRLDRTKWLNSPNVYQKVEILETGTSDPKKITKWVDQNSEEWVAESSPTHSSTPVKIESALQFVPKGTNPKEFKKLQQQIKENRRADKITSGPQSHILEGVSWEEAKKLQDANITHTGDQVILVGAASKGIIQRNYQHNALVYKTPYAKNPFDSMSDKEIEDYKQLVERKQRGDTDYEESQSESEAISSSRQDALRHLKSPLLSPQSATSETEEESRDEPRVLRIETKTAPRPIQAEVVLSDAESDSTDARVERSHSARYPKAEKPESVTLMNSFRKSWSLKREKDKSKDTENPEAFDSRNLHPSFILSDCERDRMESLHCYVARIKQITHKPLIVDLDRSTQRPLLKSVSDPCNLTNLSEDVADLGNKQPLMPKNLDVSSSLDTTLDLKRILNIRKKSIYSAKMKFLGLLNGNGDKKEAQEKVSTSPMCALISEIRETINDIMSPEREIMSEEYSEGFSFIKRVDRSKIKERISESEENLNRNFEKGEMKSRISLSRSFHSLMDDNHESMKQSKLTKPKSWNEFRKDLDFLPSEKLDSSRSEILNCTCAIHGDLSPESIRKEVLLKKKSKVDENQNEEDAVTEVANVGTISDEEGTYTVTDDSLLQTYSFTETTETEWYYNKTIMKLENSQTMLEVKESETKDVENLDLPVVKNFDTGIDTDFTSEKENEEKFSDTPKNLKEIQESQTTGDVDADAPICETSTLNKSSETDSSFLKSSSGQTSNDVDTSFAFKTETEISEKMNEETQRTSLDQNLSEKKGFKDVILESQKGEESSDSGESNINDVPEIIKPKQIESCFPKLPGIPESPEFTNIDTEDAPATSSSKDTSPDLEKEIPAEEDILETTKEPEIEFEKEKEPKPPHKRKKNVKSSTRITVKKELKEKNSDKPLVSEIKLTIKNSKPCQSEKYEVKIQDVTNTSEELSRSVSSVGENMESYESLEIADNNCGCEAQQNLEELQGEVSSTIEKLHTIEDYFQDEIKKHSNPSIKAKSKNESDDFIIEYNYREFEEIMNESRDEVELLEGNQYPGGLKKYDEEDNFCFVSSPLDDICGEVEIPYSHQGEIEISCEPYQLGFWSCEPLTKSKEDVGMVIEEIMRNAVDKSKTDSFEEILSEKSKCQKDFCEPKETNFEIHTKEIQSREDAYLSSLAGENEQSNNEKLSQLERDSSKECIEKLVSKIDPATENIQSNCAENLGEHNDVEESIPKANNAGETIKSEAKTEEISLKNSKSEIEETSIESNFDRKIYNSENCSEEPALGVNNSENDEVTQENLLDDLNAINNLSDSAEGNYENFKTSISSNSSANNLQNGCLQNEKCSPSKDAGVWLNIVENSREENDKDNSFGSNEKFSKNHTDNLDIASSSETEKVKVDECESAEETKDLEKKTEKLQENMSENIIGISSSSDVDDQISQSEGINKKINAKELESNQQSQKDMPEAEVQNTSNEIVIIEAKSEESISSELLAKKPCEKDGLEELKGASKSLEIANEVKETIVEGLEGKGRGNCDINSKNLEKEANEAIPEALSPKESLNSYQFLKVFQKRLWSPLKAITWHEKVEVSRTLRLDGISNETVNYILNCLLNSVTLKGREMYEPVNDVTNFILNNEESLVDSLTEIEDVDNIISTSNSIIADLIDSVESQLEGEVESLPDEEDKDVLVMDLMERRKPKRAEPIFKVTIATPTKKEIFINYGMDSSSTFGLSSDSDKNSELCNSYIKTDDVNDDFENLSSDNPDFFSVGSPEKNSLNSSFVSTSSGVDPGDHFCCGDCESNLIKTSPRSLGIIHEVDESDCSSTCSDAIAPTRKKK